MPRLRPVAPTPAVEHLVTAYGLARDVAEAVDAFLEYGREVDAAEALGITVAALDQRLAGNEQAQRAMAEEIKHRFNQGAVVAWRTITALASDGPPAVKLAAAKLLLERAHGKDPSLIVHKVHRDDTQLLARIDALQKKLGISTPPPVVIDLTPEPFERSKADENRARVAALNPPTVDIEIVDGPQEEVEPEPWETVGDGREPADAAA